MLSTPGTVNFPSSLDDDVSLIEAANNAATTLSSNVSNSDTTLTVSSTTSFSSTGALSIEGEIIFYTGTTSTTFTGCLRGQDSTTAVAHGSGVAVSELIVAAHHSTPVKAILALETKLGIGSSTPDTGDVLLGTSAGTSEWGTLPGATASATFFVDNTRTDVTNPNGSLLQPFVYIQDAIDAAVALASGSGSAVSAAIMVGPGTYPEQMTVALPERTFNLSLQGAGSGPGNCTLAGPINFELPNSSSQTITASIANIDFATNAGGTKLADTAFKITDAANAGFTTFYLTNMQCYADLSSNYAMHVTDAGGSGLLNVQCDGHTLIKSTESTSSSGDAVTALYLERGQLAGIGTGFYSLRAPTIILSGTASLQLIGSSATVSLGTAGSANVDCIQGANNANIRLQECVLTPAGNGNVISHSGSYNGTNGFVVLDTVGGILGSGTGGINLPNGALLLGGQMISEAGAALSVTVASSSLRLYIQRDSNVGFTAAHSSNWSTSPPTNIADAINRIAAAVVALQGGPIA